MAKKEKHVSIHFLSVFSKLKIGCPLCIEPDVRQSRTPKILGMFRFLTPFGVGED